MTLYIPPGYAHVLHSISLATDPDPMAVTYAEWLDTSIDTTTEVDTLAQTLHDLFGDDMVPQMSSQYSLQQTELRYRLASDAPTDPLRVAVATGIFTGASSDEPCVQNTAILIHKRTFLGGHRGRGRMYLTSALEGSVGGSGLLELSYLSDTQSNVNAWASDLTALTEIDGFMVLLHSTTLAIPDPLDLPPPTQVATLAVDPLVATQRRRLRK